MPTQEAAEASRYLGEDLEGVLAERVEGVGQEAKGCIRQKITEQVETRRGRLLLKALEQHPDREARPVFSWPERDKHSAAWLLALPGPNFALSNAEFSEAFAAMLACPSPACTERLGQPVPGGKRVCRWGDVVVTARMRGDGERIRHDAVKMKLKSMLQWAGIPAEVEVFNLFADAIPQEGLNRIERGRRRQGLVPDFKLAGERGGEETLCELKLMSASVSRYPRNPRPRDGVRAVDRRAEGLTAEYMRKARNVDQQYCGTPAPPPRPPGGPLQPRVIGPVESRLVQYGQVHGWCFGAWGEASTAVHSLVQRLADARVDMADTQPAYHRQGRSRAAEKAGLVAYVRRSLSVTAVREQSRLLLSRLRLLGDGTAEAARRRERAEVLEAAAGRERRAQAVSMRQGRDIMRHGFGLLNVV